MEGGLYPGSLPDEALKCVCVCGGGDYKSHDLCAAAPLLLGQVYVYL